MKVKLVNGLKVGGGEDGNGGRCMTQLRCARCYEWSDEKKKEEGYDVQGVIDSRVKIV